SPRRSSVLSNKYTTVRGYRDHPDRPGNGEAPTVAAAGAVSRPLRLGLSRVLDQNIAQPPRGYSDCEYFAGQSKGAYSASPLYVGTEVIQTAGGPDERNSDLRSELPRSDPRSTSVTLSLTRRIAVFPLTWVFMSEGCHS